MEILSPLYWKWLSMKFFVHIMQIEGEKVPIFANFQKETDCLSINSLNDRDPKGLFFMS